VNLLPSINIGRREPDSRCTPSRSAREGRRGRECCAQGFWRTARGPDRDRATRRGRQSPSGCFVVQGPAGAPQRRYPWCVNLWPKQPLVGGEERNAATKKLTLPFLLFLSPATAVLFYFFPPASAVNNAGAAHGTDHVGDILDSDIDAMFLTNVLGLISLTQLVVKGVCAIPFHPPFVWSPLAPPGGHVHRDNAGSYSI
jgi:hypothetical protein